MGLYLWSGINPYNNFCTDVKTRSKAKRRLKQLQASKPQHSLEDLLAKVQNRLLRTITSGVSFNVSTTPHQRVVKTLDEKFSTMMVRRSKVVSFTALKYKDILQTYEVQPVRELVSCLLCWNMEVGFTGRHPIIA